MQNLKERILKGETVYGCWANLGSLISAEILGQAGFDWVLVDLEHGSGDYVVMYNQLQVLSGTAATALVRTDDVSRRRVQRILDAGASGIMFPQIQTVDDARLAISGMYYPPKGIRGSAKMVRATNFGKNADNYMNNLDKNILGIIQIETRPALEQVDAIANLDGVDVLFVGPSDLTLALGIFGEFNHPTYQQAIRTVAEAAQQKGKTAGVLLQHINEYEMYHNLGYRFLACGADSVFVASGAEEMVRNLRRKISD